MSSDKASTSRANQYRCGPPPRRGRRKRCQTLSVVRMLKSCWRDAQQAACVPVAQMMTSCFARPPSTVSMPSAVIRLMCEVTNSTCCKSARAWKRNAILTHIVPSKSLQVPRSRSDPPACDGEVGQHYRGRPRFVKKLLSLQHCELTSIEDVRFGR